MGDRESRRPDAPYKFTRGSVSFVDKPGMKLEARPVGGSPILVPQVVLQAQRTFLHPRVKLLGTPNRGSQDGSQ